MNEFKSSSPYHSGTFQAYLDFTHDYPYSPPLLIFQTKILSPFVKMTGPNQGTFKSHLVEWKPFMRMRDYLESIVKILELGMSIR